ncbi:helix-turn-helix transcriptional regulator [Rhizobium rhizogenes]|uniref:helix-turn-helix transcriptional regulator n=1 Tax=Rhizobium rhizogenes TaxID=359 RepID=UPI0015736AD4|nr:AlpA family phage regulatory protein [Rhizobium rhizogenes]NTF48501.1 AlpA family phage regulatory protein [Rhizobium rhizogenes]NTH05886.1 AlpA family phage regulatory protein [Rhizobium rhizogenes]
MKTEFVSLLMSPNEAAALTTMSKPLLRAMEREGKFPTARHIGQRRIAYVRSEVTAWINERIGVSPKHQMIIAGGAQ